MESGLFCIDSQTVQLTEDQLKELTLNSGFKIVTIPYEQPQIKSEEKNAVSLPQQNMQEHFAETTTLYQPLVYQTIPSGLTLVSVPAAENYMITTAPNTNEPVKTVTCVNSPLQFCPPDIYKVKISEPGLQIRLSTLDGITHLRINGKGEAEADVNINKVVTEAIAQIYGNIDVDLEGLIVDEGIGEDGKTRILPNEQKQPVNNSGGETSSQTKQDQQSKYFEASDQGIHPQEEIIEIKEELIEETVLMNADEETIITTSEASPTPTKTVVCGFCNFASPDPNICQRCRRSLAPPPLTPPESSKETISSESETSPTKSDKEHRASDTKRRKCHRKCKKEDRKRAEQQKIENETVSLLSSDEEEETTKGHLNGYPPPRTNIFELEPVINEETARGCRDSLVGGGADMEKMIDNPDADCVMLDCRSVRFGSYKVRPHGTILINEYGIRIKVPALNKTTATIKILLADIVKVMVHFGSSGQYSSAAAAAAPVFFFYLKLDIGQKIREALHMSSSKKNDVYFDPGSDVQHYKRVTLLPETVSAQDRLFIKSIYETRCLMHEISWDEANDILVRAAPQAVQHNLKKESGIKHTPPQPSGSENIQQIMIYPPPPFKGGISINTEDYGCLREDQFLNDVIIDFYLKYLWLNVFTEEDKKRTHIFSSFFYKRLTMMPPRNQQPKENLTAAEKRHARVKGWTKSVDIFEKDFIIIPINEKSHWFLGIVCFPGLNGPVRMADNTPLPNITRKKDGQSVLVGGQTPAKLWGTTISIVKQPSDQSSNSSRASSTIRIETEEERGDDSERDEAEADDDEMEPDTTDEEAPKEEGGDLLDEATPRISKVKPNLEAIKQPCILIFDSLATQSRAKVVATLREYLQVEWKVRHKGKPKDFSKDVFKGAVPKVPQQPNFVDCGLYLLQFVEAFFKNPITDYRMPIRSIKDWFTADVVSRKRYNIMKLLHELMREQNIDTSQLNLPHLDLNPFGEYGEDGEEEEEELGEHMEYTEETVEEEEAMPEEDEEEEEEEEEQHEELAPTPQKPVQKSFVERVQHATRAASQPANRPMEIGRGVEINRVLEVGTGKTSQVELASLRRQSHQQREKSSEPSPRRFNAPSPRIDSRPSSGEVPMRPEVRAEPVWPSSQPATPRPRLPDSVTICEANSKRKLPLSLKDIRNTRLSSPHTPVEKKKPRVD